MFACQGFNALLIVSLFDIVHVEQSHGPARYSASPRTEVAVTRKKDYNGSFLWPSYPYTQAFSVVLSAITLLTLGFQSLSVSTARLIVGLLVHSGHGASLRTASANNDEVVKYGSTELSVEGYAVNVIQSAR